MVPTATLGFFRCAAQYENMREYKLSTPGAESFLCDDPRGKFYPCRKSFTMRLLENKAQISERKRTGIGKVRPAEMTNRVVSVFCRWKAFLFYLK